MNNHPYDEPDTEELHDRYRKDRRWTLGGLILSAALLLAIIGLAGWIWERALS